MYICSCNALTDRDIDAAIAAGCRTPSQIYTACGTAPQCGGCAQAFQEMLNAARRETTAQAAE